jgi:L,D-transpeptidase YbiS
MDLASTPAPVAGRPVAAAAHARRSPLRAVLLVVGLAILGAAAWGTGYEFRAVGDDGLAPPALDIPNDTKALRTMRTKLDRRQRALLAQLERKRPRGNYIVIDQTQNRLYLMKDEQVVREAICSAGSGMILKEGAEGGRKWVFDTPRGNFKVLSKIDNPVWKKPDWAFVEEGLPIPKDPSERFDPAALGEYALYFGDGYMIHGTLYERLLGRSVTHGCIRLGRDDLREVFRAAPLGTPIYIY